MIAQGTTTIYIYAGCTLPQLVPYWIKGRQYFVTPKHKAELEAEEVLAALAGMGFVE